MILVDGGGGGNIAGLFSDYYYINVEGPAPEPECATDNDCDGGRICSDGKCICPAGTYWNSQTQQCEAEPEPECTTDSDCGGGRVCKNNKCVCPDGTRWNSEKGYCEKVEALYWILGLTFVALFVLTVRN